MGDVVAIVTDLFFQSRISAAGTHAGKRVRFITNGDALGDLQDYAVALVDLDATLDVPEAIRRLKSLPGGPIIAFGPHVDTAARKAAKAAGADRVLAKSKFVTDLPEIMTRADSG
jgi:CheY-like chemotaxis protein